MNLIDPLLESTEQHQRALNERLVELNRERREIKGVLRDILRYRKRLLGRGPVLPMLPDQPLIRAIEAANPNGEPGDAFEEPLDFGPGYEEEPAEFADEPISPPLEQASPVIGDEPPADKPKRKRSKA